MELPYLYFINTVSIAIPSPVPRRYFLVPSFFDACTFRIFIDEIYAPESVSLSRSSFERSVISEKSDAESVSRPYIHRKTCLPLNFFSPNSVKNCSISSVVISLRSTITALPQISKRSLCGIFPLLSARFHDFPGSRRRSSLLRLIYRFPEAPPL